MYKYTVVLMALFFFAINSLIVYASLWIIFGVVYSVRPYTFDKLLYDENNRMKPKAKKIINILCCSISIILGFIKTMINYI